LHDVQIKLLDALPEAMPKIGDWSKKILLDEGNITMATLFVCLVTVLYLRQRRINAQVVPPPPPPPQ
jgi:SEL1 protein